MISAVRPASTVRTAFCTSRSDGLSMGGRRLVEDEHRRVGEAGTRERDQLALAGAEPTALVGDVGRVALGVVATTISSIVASGRPKRMLSAMVPENK
jgi:hypothetical protein